MLDIVTTMPWVVERLYPRNTGVADLTMLQFVALCCISDGGRCCIMKIPRHHLSLAEASKRLGVNRVTLWRWVKAGKIASVRRVADRVISEAEINRILKGQGEKKKKR